ncbi:NAD(P)H binding domain of trans-2-enoyl-CoA reductase family protein [Burkholderia ambifaria AMMD]|uniref:Short-chain dehydrogenase/reductase SDR n=1 Tax=Burkholderia ambifaria (strain ATCC BAA-244 / DSM 16087 / CCUG 44356 / LMG 19182 / AMMD) TaxID=339670 RepID=Q0BCY7_BURCM|nr:SDR family NAD(P)-dependent oxidoreductase [Burkholderia ambifaria]ABI87986.1 short-chain dehydrogenase/reductase SDR [Burkholderia ambifaria AMMD]AJY22992.1 NAD(P)H binding domain of trans-2-enoyl-CoA reductase family protein [Burkholderia ambifaria AMMD]MBR7932731.1 SDR family NAD(P)-dependent oxidoreductase [Burkholderia ambifaria]PEH64848.1 oxidoreductase [Burkholderia ambifaria]QQC04823.1 SDR family NAD(P)-dependent oxidoreductase [Burkholderia ambifaria]
MNRLQGKRALVTGGSRGIGAAIAKRLAADGADVAITYEKSAERARAVVADIEALGRRAVAIQADSADPVAVRGAVDHAAQTLGGLDILVNNAGIFRAGALDDLTLDDIDATLNVNVRAVIVASQAAARHLGEGGRIVSTGSCLATRVPDAGMSLYAASKAALIGWTQGLARDLGARGITVNLVHPGSTDTDMNPADGEHAGAQRSRMATPQYGKAEDVAALVAFVVGPEGRSINGTGLTIDGGANA